MATTYTENPAGISEMLRSPEMVAAMHHLAQKGADRFDELAPIRTGHLVESAYVESGISGDTAYGEWGAEAGYTVFVEFGTKYMEAQRVLGLSIDAVAE